MARLHAEAREEWRLLDVGARAVLLVNLARGGGDFILLRFLLGKVGVELAIDFRLDVERISSNEGQISFR